MTGKYVVDWRRRKKIALVAYKGGKCIECGYDKCVDALCFHHRDPSKKEITISASTRAFEALKKEVDKCDLLCMNCHTELHSRVM